MPSEAAKQFRNELQSLANRYAEESDIDVAEIVMVLEVMKFSILMAEENHLRKKESDE